MTTQKNRPIRGIRDSVPSGYVLGRTSAGMGDVEAITMADFYRNLVIRSGKILVGNAAGRATTVSVSGDGTLDSAGALTVTSTNGVPFAASATTDTTDASNITSGTLPSGRLTGSYTGITGVGTLTAGTWNASVIGLAYGGTGADLSATGGASQFLKQNSAGATITVAQVADADLSTSDVTTNDVSTSKHGFAPKAPNDATKYLDGTGNYSVPPSGGGGFMPKVDGAEPPGLIDDGDGSLVAVPFS